MLELYNRGTNPVPIAGLVVTDLANGLTSAALPADSLYQSFSGRSMLGQALSKTQRGFGRERGFGAARSPSCGLLPMALPSSPHGFVARRELIVLQPIA